MSVLGLRNAIVSSIGSEIPTFRKVEAADGRFDVNDLKRLAVYAPSALVAVLNGDCRREAAVAVGDVKIAVFIVTGGTSALHRGDAAITLVEAVVGLAAANHWAYSDAKPPQVIRFENLYSGAIDKLGVALWVVRWEQRLDLATPSTEDFDELRSVYVDTDFADKDGVVEDEQIIELQGTLMSAYGQIYVSSSAATSIASADTYQKAGGTTTLLRADGFDMPSTGRLRHTDAVTRPVSVEVTASAAVDADAKVTMTVAVNGAPVEEAEVEEELTSAGGAEAMVVKALVELTEDDYVETWVKADDTVNVTLSKMSLVAVAT